jgi:hypothetical protein
MSVRECELSGQRNPRRLRHSSKPARCFLGARNSASFKHLAEKAVLIEIEATAIAPV